MTREEAIQEILMSYDISQDTKDAAIEALQERKMGEWIGGELGNCSVCGHKGCASDIWDRCAHTYCPNCGARLEVLREQSSTEVKIFADGMPLEEYLTREWKKQRAYLEEHGFIFRDGGTKENETYHGEQPEVQRVPSLEKSGTVGEVQT